MKRLLLILLLLSGCGYGFDGYPIQCTTPDASKMHGAEGLVCTQVLQEVGLVRGLLTESGLANIDESQTVTSALALLVRPQVFWEAPPGKVDGEYLPEVDAMVIGRNGFAIMHETLHRLDAQRGLPGTLDHLDWDKRGYWAALESWKGVWTDTDLYGGQE